MNPARAIVKAVRGGAAVFRISGPLVALGLERRILSTMAEGNAPPPWIDEADFAHPLHRALFRVLVLCLAHDHIPSIAFLGRCLDAFEIPPRNIGWIATVAARLPLDRDCKRLRHLARRRDASKEADALALAILDPDVDPGLLADLLTSIAGLLRPATMRDGRSDATDVTETSDHGCLNG